MDEPDRSLIDQVADVALYAPIGFLLDARRVVPEMAERGRRQVTFNWMVGRYALRRARSRADEVVDVVQQTAEGLIELAGLGGEAPAPGAESQDEPGAPDAGTAGTATGVAPSAPPHLTSVDGEGGAGGADAPDPGDLAIPGYDSLSAFQVVPRLDGLGDDELEAVRRYERATRGRRTILSRIAQLQAS